MNFLLFASFSVNAAISAFVGLGGGTYYLLLLQLFDVKYMLIPFIALLGNICVSGVSASVRLGRHEYRGNGAVLACALIPAMAAAYAGGQIVFAETPFRLFLSTAILFIACIRLLKPGERPGGKDLTVLKAKKAVLLAVVSMGIGLLSGIIGIGGGIMLGPLLYAMGFSYRRIPCITAAYICINSLIGLVSQTIKYTRVQGRFVPLTAALKPYVPLVAVCAAAGLFSLCIRTRFSHERYIRGIVLCVTMSLVLYNFVKTVVSL